MKYLATSACCFVHGSGGAAAHCAIRRSEEIVEALKLYQLITAGARSFELRSPRGTVMAVCLVFRH